MVDQPKVSLSFTRKFENKLLKLSALASVSSEGSLEKNLRKHNISCFDKDSNLLSETSDCELIIPLIKSKRTELFNKQKPLSIPSPKENKSDDLIKEKTLDEQAAEAIIEETKKKITKKGSVTADNQCIELDSTVALEIGQDSSLDDYEKINVESYGLALLRGMGWRKDIGVGKNRKCIEVIEPSAKSLGSTTSSSRNVSQDEDEEIYLLKQGSFVFIHSGRNKGTYGTVESVDELQVLIRSAIGEKIINEVEQNIKPISGKEFKDSSRVINKEKYDEYKIKEASKKQRKGGEGDYRMEEAPPERKINRHHYNSPKPNETANHSSSLQPLLSSKQIKNEYKAHKEDNSSRVNHSNKMPLQQQPSIPWAKPNLRVRIIDKSYKEGRYHKEKVIVRDVESMESCTCMTDDGKLLFDIRPNCLETVIPKPPSTLVLIIRGRKAGQKGRILQLQKEEERATVQLLADSSLILTLHYDDICEYVAR